MHGTHTKQLEKHVILKRVSGISQSLVLCDPAHDQPLVCLARREQLAPPRPHRSPRRRASLLLSGHMDGTAGRVY